MGRVRQLDDDERRPHPVGATPRLLGQARFGKRSPDERYPGSPPAVVIPHVAGYGRLAACTAPSCAAGRSPDGSRPISAVSPIATELCAPQRTARSATTRLMHRANTSLVYSITSSARASSVGGTSMPSAFAVLRLMMRSNLVGGLHRQICRLLALERTIRRQQLRGAIPFV